MPESELQAQAPAALQGDRYERGTLIGRGSCGAVYRARDTIIGREVALKVIRFDSSFDAAEIRELSQRAEREARAAGTLSHPNIVTVYDAGKVGDGVEFFIVMEFVEGIDLRSRLGAGPVPAQDVALLGCQIARALHYAHGVGVVHRDVKPANILLRADGVAKITDFGIARIDASELTHSGQWIGSPAYMSPEQARGQSAGPQSDLFALGVVLYEALTGERPFRGESVAALGYQIVNANPVSPSSLVRGLPRRWDALLARVLAKAPEARPRDAQELSEELERLADRTDARITGPVRMRQSGEWMRTDESGSHGEARTLIVLDDEDEAGSPRDMTSSRIRARRRGRVHAALAAGVTALLALLLSGFAWLGPVRIAAEPPFSVELVHGLGSGEMQLFIDGNLAWGGTLEQIKDINRFRPFRRASGFFPPNRASVGLEVPPGERRVSVQVTSPDGNWLETVKHRFVDGKKEHLVVYVKTGPTRGMLLEWQ